MDPAQVAENINMVIKEVVKKKPADTKGEFVSSVAVASTMGPGVKVDFREVL